MILTRTGQVHEERGGRLAATALLLSHNKLDLLLIVVVVSVLVYNSLSHLANVSGVLPELLLLPLRYPALDYDKIGILQCSVNLNDIRKHQNLALHSPGQRRIRF